MKHLLNVDLGSLQDYTAITDLERIVKFRPKTSLPGTQAWENEKRVIVSEYHLKLIERPPLGTRYQEIVDYLCTLMQTAELAKQTVLLADCTGAGWPVIQMMQDSGLQPIPVWITNGSQVTDSKTGGFNVPKRDIMASLQIVFQTRRLKIAQGLDYKDQLLHELTNFKLKPKPSGHEAMEAWREGDHDDIVLSAAMGTWYAEKLYGNNVVVERAIKREKQKTLRYGLGAKRK